MNVRRYWPLLPPIVLAVAISVIHGMIWWKGFRRCFFLSVTGKHCPGCGGTRAASAVMEGDIPRAFGHNALLMGGLFLLVLLICYLILRITILGKIDTRLPAISSRWLWVLLVAVVLFTVLRNIPSKPFDMLAP